MPDAGEVGAHFRNTDFVESFEIRGVAGIDDADLDFGRERSLIW
jgi:hypothetical protein